MNRIVLSIFFFSVITIVVLFNTNQYANVVILGFGLFISLIIGGFAIDSPNKKEIKTIKHLMKLFVGSNINKY